MEVEGFTEAASPSFLEKLFNVPHTSSEASLLQNEGNEGFFGTVRNYIPGMASPEPGTQTNSGYQQGKII